MTRAVTDTPASRPARFEAPFVTAPSTPASTYAWHLLTNDSDYDDLGGDWFARRTDTDKHRGDLVRQLQDLAYGVTLTNLAA